jgi:hypothetical protein
VPGGDARTPLAQPTRSGIELTVLLDLSILRVDEFRRQGEHRFLSRFDDHRCDGNLVILALAVGEGARGAVVLGPSLTNGCDQSSH